MLTTPVMRHLKNEVFNGAEVHYLTKKEYASILQASPYIDKVYTIEKSTAEVREQLAHEEYHYIIDLHKNIRSRMVKSHTKVLSFELDKLNWQKWLWVNLGINRMPNKHIVDRYLETIESFGIINDGKGLDYFVSEESEKSIQNILRNSGLDTYYTWVLSAAHEGKRFGNEKVKGLLAHLPYPVVLIGGNEDKELSSFLAREYEHVFDLCGDTTIDESAAIIKRSKFIISPDTGMMHISAALKKHIISYWGCTHPGLGMSPYMPGDHSIILQPEGRSKRPCSKLGNRCKYKNQGRCPDAISDQVVVESINKLWELV